MLGYLAEELAIKGIKNEALGISKRLNLFHLLSPSI